ncbi:hypothetical protein A2O72_001074 [Salmonella enterica subsp. enterica serovar Takoradi]|nr:hypothetical protein [Salmonella enterica subsp. enterica serovar Takoradi]
MSKLLDRFRYFKQKGDTFADGHGQCSGSQKARTRSKKDATPCCVASYVNYWPECSDLGYG